MDDEFTRRVQKAIEDLEALKSRYARDNYFEVGRINGKIEGVKLALDYYIRLKQDNLILQSGADGEGNEDVERWNKILATRKDTK